MTVYLSIKVSVTRQEALSQLQDCPELHYFINSIKSPATLNCYCEALSNYIKFCKLTSPSDLLKEDRKIIEKRLIDYIIHLRKELQVSFVFTRTRLAGIKKFYEISDITTINWKKVYQFLGEKTRAKKDRAYTTEEIQQLLTKCDERMRCCVLILASTGMRIGAIPDLKMKHLTKIENLYQITVYENSNEEYYCFTTPEAAAAIDSYLSYRERYNEKITAESPLIRDNFNRRDSKRSKNAKSISLNSLFWLLSDLLKSSGVQQVEHAVESKKLGRIRKDVMRSHGFRKFVNTNMVKSKVDASARELLIGHSIQLGDSYYRPQPEELLEEYLKAVDMLTINEENRLKRKVEILSVRKEKLDELTQTVEMVRRKLGV